MSPDAPQEYSTLDLWRCVNSGQSVQSYCTNREDNSRHIQYVGIDLLRKIGSQPGQPCVLKLQQDVDGGCNGVWKSMDMMQTVVFVYPYMENNVNSSKLFSTVEACSSDDSCQFCVSGAQRRWLNLWIPLNSVCKAKLVLMKANVVTKAECVTVYKTELRVENLTNPYHTAHIVHYIPGMLLETDTAWYRCGDDASDNRTSIININSMQLPSTVYYCSKDAMVYEQRVLTSWLERATDKCVVFDSVVRSAVKASMHYLSENLPGSQNLLLYGGSGSGKTFLASAIAETALLPFTIIDCSSLHSSTRGSASEELTRAFRRSRGGVLVLDDVDTLRVFDGLHNLNELELLATLHSLLQSVDGPKIVLCTATDPTVVDNHVSTQITLAYKVEHQTIDDIYALFVYLVQDKWDETQESDMKVLLENRQSVCTPADLQLICRSVQQTNLDKGKSSGISIQDVETAISQCGFISSIRTTKHRACMLPSVDFNDCLVNSVNSGGNDTAPYTLPKYNLVGLDMEVESVRSLFHSRPGVTSVLVTGEVGSGKTAFAQVCASSLHLPVFNVSSAELWQKQLGGTEESVAALFKDAAASAPCCIMLEKADSLMRGRVAFCIQQGLDSQKDKHVLCVMTCVDMNQVPYSIRQISRVQKIVRMPSLIWTEKWLVMLQMLKRTPVHLSGARATEYDAQWPNLRSCFAHLATHLHSLSLTSIRGLVTAACMNAVREMQLTPHADVSVLPHDQVYGFKTVGINISSSETQYVPTILVNNVEWLGPDEETYPIVSNLALTLEQLILDPILRQRCTDTELTESEDSDIETPEHTHTQQERLARLNKLRN